MPRRIDARAMFERIALFLLALSFVKTTSAFDWKTVQFAEKLDPPVVLTPIHSGAAKFAQPVWFSPVPGLEDTHIILEHQTGKAWLLEGKDGKTLFADWGEAVSDGPWEGLMCIAFHPSFPQNRRFFIKHEALIEGQRHTTIVEKRAAEDLRSDSGEISTRLLAIKQPADNHNGGTLLFGPDGYLYIGMGDGGPQEDPKGYTQSGQSLLGKMLRIDVDDVPQGQPYGIPQDNPFTDRDPNKWRHEIWALGLREPWRFSFDLQTDELWLGDVGQVLYEEVLILKPGENHGWNVREGWQPFKDTYQRPNESYVEPLLAYGRHLGASVTGGYVYRGAKSPGFQGVYVFGDFNTRKVWGLRAEAGRVTALLELAAAPDAVASFGEGRDGELYLVGYGGTIYHLELGLGEFPKERPLALQAWQEKLTSVREAAEIVMGDFPPNSRRVALELQVDEAVDMGSYVRQLVTFQSEPDCRTPAYLCVPKQALEGEKKVPGVLCLHPTDHQVGHKVVVGLGGKAGRQYATELAERGYVTIAPSYPLLANYWPNIPALGYESGTMKGVWDSSRALDVLESLPYVRTGKGFAAIGHSLGGHNAIFSAVFDDRIRVVASSCGFDAFADYYDGDQAHWYYGKGWCQLRYMPRMSNYRDRLGEIPFDFKDLLAALAPRKLFVSAPLHDDNFRWKSVQRTIAHAKTVYAQYQAGAQIAERYPNTGHEFSQAMREEAYDVIRSV